MAAAEGCCELNENIFFTIAKIEVKILFVICSLLLFVCIWFASSLFPDVILASFPDLAMVVYSIPLRD